VAIRSHVGVLRPKIQGTPPAQLPPRQPIALPISGIRPVMRIAHHILGPIVIPERIIFDHEAVVLVRGGGVLRLRDGEVPLAAHQLLLLPPWLPHVFDCPEVCEHIAVHFDLAPEVPSTRLDRRPAYQVELGPDHELPLWRALQPSDGIEDGFIQVVEDWESGTDTGQVRAHARLSLLLALLLRERSSAAGIADGPGGNAAGAGLPDGMRQALAAMRARYTEALTLSACARIAGLSPTRFAHRFRDMTGYAPMEFVRRLRIDQARRLLADQSLTIRAVAEACGFGDPYHFSRVFRAIDGLPPSLYREALLAGRTHPER
jgi:AraC-like DNA-binding protein